MTWTLPHLLGIEGLSSAAIGSLLDRALVHFDAARAGHTKGDALRGKTIVNLFFESSTRTRSSFEIAGKRLGADVINVGASGSSVSKGETLKDTAKNLEAMGADVLVIRHGASGAPHFVAKCTKSAVVNAGDGTHEHPTQALLDALTIRRAKGRLDGLCVAICGDIAHSRVARSNAILLRTMGAGVRLCGPKTMMPRAAHVLAEGVTIHDSLASALTGADVVMMLRIQHERLGGAMLATTREYSRTFGLGPKTLALAKPDAIVMHPGPINRGVELHPAVADGERSVILEQVEAGVAVRMAVLEFVQTARSKVAA
jgi:aspartate carbamoyltransferase catalytic subunit